MPSFVAAVSRNPASSNNPGSSLAAAASEFSIQQEDFPALPGGSNSTIGAASMIGRGDFVIDDLTAAAFSIDYLGGGGGGGSVGGRVIRDQFGMLGLLAFIRLCEQNREETRYIGPGVDPGSVGLPMTQQSDIHPLLASPLSDLCLRKPQYSDHPVPVEYLVGPQIRDRLPPPPLDQLPLETLFWLFYACACDRLQLCAAKQLHKRHWRWVKADKLWLTRSGDTHERLPGSDGERGRYLCWDMDTWSVQARDLDIKYDQIDDSPANFPDPTSTTVHTNNNSSAIVAASNSTNDYHQQL